MIISWSTSCSRGRYMNSPSVSFEEGEKEVPGITIQEAINQLEIAKTASNRRPVYVKELCRFLRQFARGNENKALSLFTASQIETWLAAHKYCPTSRKACIGRVSTLFEFAKRRRWLKINPCDEIEKPITEWKVPRIFTPEESEKLLRACQTDRPTMLAYLVLCLLVGCRPTEAREITSENIKGDTIRIIISKVRQRRIINPMPSALAWLKYSMPFAKLPMSEPQRKRCHHYFRSVLGLKVFPQDACRHTAISYLLAVKQDAPWVAMQCGTSPAMVFTHYRDLVEEADAKKFWQIYP